MFVNSDYKNYKYLVSVSDNYAVLTNRRSVSADWQHPVTIDVIYQYFTPSIITLEDTMSLTSDRTFSTVDISDDYFDRADCPQIITCTFIVIFFIMFVLNALTRFVRKGGVFFGT